MSLPLIPDKTDTNDRAVQQIRRYARQYRPLPYEELRELVAAHQAGVRSATDKILRHSASLVIRFCSRYERLNVPRADLYQEAMIGIDAAATRFDLSRETSFSTYAYHWMRFYTQAFLRHMIAPIRIKRTQTVRHMDEIPTFLDLDASVGHDGDMTLGDILSAEDCLDMENRTPEDIVSDIERLRKVRYTLSSAIAQLSPKAAAIMTRRLLSVDHPTFTEIGDEMGVVRQCVHQYHARAIRRLKEIVEDPDARAVLDAA